MSVGWHFVWYLCLARCHSKMVCGNTEGLGGGSCRSTLRFRQRMEFSGQGDSEVGEGDTAGGSGVHVCLMDLASAPHLQRGSDTVYQVDGGSD